MKASRKLSALATTMLFVPPASAQVHDVVILNSRVPDPGVSCAAVANVGVMKDSRRPL